jgi:hypothetical protein
MFRIKYPEAEEQTTLHTVKHLTDLRVVHFKEQTVSVRKGLLVFLRIFLS